MAFSALRHDARRRARQLCAALLALALALTLALASGISDDASAQTLQQKIQRKRDLIARAQTREGVLSTTISRYSRKIGRLRGEVASLRNREFRVQSELDRRQSSLDSARTNLRRERRNLRRLRFKLRRSITVLSDRLVAIYKSNQPDMLTVILESDGFADLVDRAEYMSRIENQDSRVVGRVRDLKDQSRRSVGRLSSLERRVRTARDEIASKRRELARTRGTLETRQSDLVGARAGKRSALRRVSRSRSDSEEELRALEREEARVRGTLNSVSGPAGRLGPVRGGSRGMIWPVNGTVTSPFGPRWGRLHAGVDIAAPGGTPLRAAKSGVVAIAAPTGGYGNYVCIAHGGGLSSCYAHMSRIGTRAGARVSQGQGIGAVGCTGRCFGDHVHFEVRVNGVPTDPMGYL